MKKTILTTLIAAGISTAPLANELAKLNFATDSAAQAPAQKVVIQKKEAIKSTSQYAEDADTISELIFDASDMNQLAVLDKEEMLVTKGGVADPSTGGFGGGPIMGIPNGMSWGQIAANMSKGAAKEFAKGAAITQATHYVFHREPADLTTTVVGGVIQTIGGTRAAYPGVVGTTMPTTGYSAFVEARNTAITTVATLPWYSSNSTNKPSSSTSNSSSTEQHSAINNISQDPFTHHHYIVEIPKKPIAMPSSDVFSYSPPWKDNFVEVRINENNINPSSRTSHIWGFGSSGDR